ncbi:MAG: ATP-binding protein [Sciscionella sp.]
MVSTFEPGHESVVARRHMATAPAPDQSRADAIEVRVAATPTHLSAVRAVAADLAMQQDMNLDDVADLRLAVDEACSSLVGLARDGSELRCRFTVHPGEMRFTASVRSGAPTGPDRTAFSWQVLATLADDASSRVEEDGGGYLVAIELCKSLRK